MDVNKKSKGGRKPKMNPSKNRYVFRLTDEENIKFLNLYEVSGMSNKAKFITTILFQKELKIVKVDISTIDYHTQLTKFFYQFQSIGNNYNQIVKILYRNFSEKKASFYLFKLENHTRELALIGKQIIELTKEFEQNHIQKNSEKMIAKIGKGENLWGALTYNQQKVDNEKGTVLFTNKIPDLWDRPYSVRFFHQYFEPYLIANNKTEKPVRHISLNPDPEDKVNDKDYREMAQQYMQEMGYGNQPYVVFKHTDIDRTHIHIVTTCVQIDGKKISDRYDHPQSMETCRKLERQYNLKVAGENRNLNQNSIFKPIDYTKGNIKTQLSSILRHIPQTYSIQSIGAYNALLSQFNISCEEVTGELHGKMRQGIVYFATDKNGKKVSNPFKSSLFGKHVGVENIQVLIEKSKVKMKNNPSKLILKRTIETALSTSKSEASFKTQLLEQGIATVIRKNDDGRIYGITFIDHNSKSVWNGSQLSKELSANAFNKLWNEIETKPETNSYNRSNNDISLEKSSEHFFNNNSYEVFDGFFSGLLSSGPHEDQEEQIFESQMKKRQRKRRKK